MGSWPKAPQEYEPLLDAEMWQATRYVNPDVPLTECVQLVLTEEAQE